ncbi:hypothetical protein NKH28_31515 [Mesorhizobium sp. M1227]|uniref:hypothetical protein n=1 Tax=Mesorhizobium sp. M1227 TaxID=2957071 RepID=UPI00333D4C14
MTTIEEAMAKRAAHWAGPTRPSMSSPLPPFRKQQASAQCRGTKMTVSTMIVAGRMVSKNLFSVTAESASSRAGYFSSPRI